MELDVQPAEQLDAARQARRERLLGTDWTRVATGTNHQGLSSLWSQQAAVHRNASANNRLHSTGSPSMDELQPALRCSQ
jgi:hypothetical protein